MTSRSRAASIIPANMSRAAIFVPSQATGAIKLDAIYPKMIYVVVLCLIAGKQSWLSSTPSLVDAEVQQHDNPAHRPVYADIKYWIRSTEFGERDNWLNQLRPCTLFERIKMNEQSVVSMGSSMDLLGGSILNNNIIKELTLAQNGMLLLEEDLPEDPIEAAYIDYIKLIGDCTDGDSVPGSADANSGDQGQQALLGVRHTFEFKPDSDEMSWFNPQNWASMGINQDTGDGIPESHQVPCGEDVVVFGDRHHLLAPFLETGEREATATFKVNFRPSMASQQVEAGDTSETRKLIDRVDSLRVARLFIGDRQYDQQEFDKLIDSDDYRDILFQFNDSNSALKQDFGGYSGGPPPLTIDESSLVRDTSQNICLDEAGCFCGNERAEVMKVICSFHDPLGDDELPCHDPIRSAGYCNKICATTLTISMDPSRFSERFLASLIDKLFDDSSKYFGSVLVGPRRVDDDKYEIVFRYIPDDEDAHWSSPGIELVFAQTILQQLERGSTKSFYGIRAITTKSSVQWRQNNKSFIFWLTATSLSLISVAIFALKHSEDSNNTNIDSSFGAQTWLTNIWYQVNQSKNSDEIDSESFIRFTNRPTPSESGTSDLHGSLSNIPLMELDENDTEDQC